MLLIISVNNLAAAQEYKKLRATIGLGVTNGILIYFEPSYRVKDNLAFAVRFEDGIHVTPQEGIYSVGSKSILGQYYLRTNSKKNHPFVGLGIGIFNASGFGGLLCDCEKTIQKQSFGFFPRLGYDNRHFTLSLDINLISSFRESTISMMPGSSVEPSYQYINTSYIGVRAGLTIGGGRRNKIQTYQ